MSFYLFFLFFKKTLFACHIFFEVFYLSGDRKTQFFCHDCRSVQGKRPNG